MKNKLIKYISVITLVILFDGCQKSFLDLKPQGLQTEVSFYSDFGNVDETVTAAYSVLNSYLIFDVYNTIYLGSVSSDDAEAGGENTGDQATAHAIDRMMQAPSDNNDPVYQDYWGYNYKGIRMVNTALEYLPQMGTLDPSVSTALVNQRIAECKFLRAFYYFSLAQTFGGVPIILSVPNPSVSYPRNTLKEVYTQIEKDLTEAIPDLLLRSQLGTAGVGRATKGAAQSLLAKAYLYESSYAENYPNDSRFAGMVNHYADALSNAQAVINSGEYELVGSNGERWNNPPSSGLADSSWWATNGDPVGGFRWIFSEDGNNCKEMVFQIQSVEDQLGYIKSRGSYITVYSTVRFYQNTKGASTNFGWSFNCPTSYLVNSFANNDNRETGLSSTPTGDEALDPRFATTVGRPGDSVYVHDAGGLGWFPMLFSNLPTHTIGRKYECSPQEYWSVYTNYNEGAMGARLIRYADVVLFAAEAAFKTGDQTNALKYVNMVRARAAASGNTGFPKQLSAITFADIVHERRLELALEGSRFYDLVRWNLASTFITGTTLDSYPGSTVTFQTGKNEFFPISTTDIQTSHGALVQNPGY